MALMSSSVLGELRSSAYVPAFSTPTATATATLSPQQPRRSSTRVRHTFTGTGTDLGSGAATSARRKTARGSVTERDMERPPHPRPRAGSLSAAYHHHGIGIGLPAQPLPLHVLLSTGQAPETGQARAAHEAAAAERDTRRHSGRSGRSFVCADSYSSPSPALEPLGGAVAARDEFTFVHPHTLANIALGSVLPHPGASGLAYPGSLGVSPLSPPPPERVSLFSLHSHAELRRQSQADRDCDRHVRDTDKDINGDDDMRSPTRSTSHTPSPGHTPQQNAPLACAPQVCTNHAASAFYELA